MGWWTSDYITNLIPIIPQNTQPLCNSETLKLLNPVTLEPLNTFSLLFKLRLGSTMVRRWFDDGSTMVRRKAHQPKLTNHRSAHRFRLFTFYLIFLPTACPAGQMDIIINCCGRSDGPFAHCQLLFEPLNSWTFELFNFEPFLYHLSFTLCQLSLWILKFHIVITHYS